MSFLLRRGILQFLIKEVFMSNFMPAAVCCNFLKRRFERLRGAKIFLGKVPVLFYAALAAAVMLAGCKDRLSDSEWDTAQNSIYVTREQGVMSALVHTSRQKNSLYSQEELTEQLKQAVADYTAEYGDVFRKGERIPSVSLRSCMLEGQTGKAVFEYASPEDFVLFSMATGDNTHSIRSLSVRPVSEELAAGELGEEGQLIGRKGGQTSAQEVAKHPNYRAVAVDGAGRVCTEGKIAYTSAAGVTVVDDHTAVTDEGKHYIIFK